MTALGTMICERRFFLSFLFALLAPSLLIAASNLRGGLSAATPSELLLQALCLFFYATCFLSLCLVRAQTPRRALLFAAIVGAVLFNTADLIFFINTHAQLKSIFLFQIKETNPQALSGAFELHLRKWQNLLIPLYWEMALLLLLRRKRGFPKPGAVFALALAATLALGLSGAVAPASGEDAMTIKTLPDMALEYLEENVPANAMRKSIAKANGSIVASCPDAQACYVLVIGESHSKYHCGLYGYPRDVNPRLAKLKDAGELLVFEDVVSPNSFTTYVVPKLLSLASNESGEAAYETQNVFDAMKAAGFKTFFLSNQVADMRDLQIACLAERADSVRMPPTLIQENDARLLPLYRAALSDLAPRKLIVLHLWGSHFEYETDYPAGFSRFKPQDDELFFNEEQRAHLPAINAYDNGVLFNDGMLASFIESLAEKGGKGALIYLSDHGENLYELRSMVTHMDFLPTIYTVEIPMFLWLSKDYKAEAPESWLKALPGRLSRPCSSEDSIHSLFDLANVSTPVFDPAKSVLNDSFAPKRRIVSNDGIDYETLKKASSSDIISGRMKR